MRLAPPSLNQRSQSSLKSSASNRVEIALRLPVDLFGRVVEILSHGIEVASGLVPRNCGITSAASSRPSCVCTRVHQVVSSLPCLRPLDAGLLVDRAAELVLGPIHALIVEPLCGQAPFRLRIVLYGLRRVVECTISRRCLNSPDQVFEC